MQWKDKDCQLPGKFRTQPSAGKIIDSIFLDSTKIILRDYLARGSTITGRYYADLMSQLLQTTKNKRQGKLTRGVQLLHDIAPSIRPELRCQDSHKFSDTDPSNLIISRLTHFEQPSSLQNSKKPILRHLSFSYVLQISLKFISRNVKVFICIIQLICWVILIIQYLIMSFHRGHSMFKMPATKFPLTFLTTLRRDFHATKFPLDALFYAYTCCRNLLTEYGRRVTIVADIQNDLYHPENSRISHEIVQFRHFLEVKNILNFPNSILFYCSLYGRL